MADAVTQVLYLTQLHVGSTNKLRLLIDGVLFGQHIPKEIATELISKLKGMSELGLKNRVRKLQKEVQLLSDKYLIKDGENS